MRRWPWLGAGALGAWAASRAAGAFRVEVTGESMAPALLPGDWLVATRRGTIRRGSVVVLAHPIDGLDLVKRVAGVPGDDVGDRVLGPAEFLVVGDNAGASTDGRSFGPVDRRLIEGVVRARYWPSPGLVRPSEGLRRATAP
ncbi:MAG: S26 family signal peptidase [Actinomycetota bacterium]